jgi:stringent starvation protein B
LAEIEGDGAEAVQFVLDEQDEPVSDDSESKPAGLRSVSGASEDSKPLSVAKSDKSDEKTSKKPGQKKKNHLTRVK